MEEKAAVLGLSPYCRFLGFRSDVQELLRSFDVFVLSSLWEGLPISLLEAQHFGVAAVVTDVGGIPEVVTDGYNGLLVPSKDPGALASAILRLLANDALRNELAEHGKRVFAERFTSEKMADAYLGLSLEIFRARGLSSAHMSVGSQRGEEK
jgi:glycosyltransferase involved in cell wall biosynthesis